MRLKNTIRIGLFSLVLFLCGMSGSGLHAQAPPPIADDLSNVIWLDADVSSWKQTANLRCVTISSSHITLDYDKARTWPGELNANPWIFVYRNNNWYAATWEWLRFGQTVKGLYAVNGDHIKKDPLTNFTPRTGELYGFMVSGTARNHVSPNVRERSNIVMLNWKVPSTNLAAQAPVVHQSTPTQGSNLLLLNPRSKF
ncbi:MAG: hypothetical protein RBR09_06225 [Desulfobulbaceae bacterium]|jgi:hypothetical protein|nr:hypothetical protein [Desulfobulbaceae bacterium]MDY0350834.1 hypothetical protein [Desulfobulbaceae bacterium]